MSTSDKLTYLNTTKSKIKQAINLAGASLTNEPFRQYSSKLYDRYLDILKNGTSALYSAMPKVTGTGTELSLKNTAKAPMVLELSASESTQDTLLPSEYQQVEYIQSSGNQYIDTNVLGKSGLTYELKFILSNLSSDVIPMGCREENSYRAYLLDKEVDNDVFLGFGTNYIKTNISGSIFSNVNIVKTILKDGEQKIYINNELEYENNLSQSFSINNSIYLFASNNGTVITNKLVGKVYYAKIYDNDTLIRDFIPCYRNSDNEVGMYDLVNDVFYTNQDTDTFAKGANVDTPTPDYPQTINVVTGNNSITIEDEDNTLSQTFPLSLGSLELAGIGNYKDKIFNNIPSNPLYDSNLVEGGWYKYKRIGKAIFDGTEDLLVESNGRFGYRSTTIASKIGGNLLTPATVDSLLGNMSNIYKEKTAGQTWSKNEGISVDDAKCIRIWDNTYSPTSDSVGYKAQLNTQNLIFYGILAEPIPEQITDTTLVSQLNAIKSAISYDNETNISQTNANRPFIISASAVKNSME